jgi:hypothetical protein
MPKLAAGFELVRALGPRLQVNISEPKARREVVALAKRPLGTLWGIQLHENDAQWISDDVLTILAPAMQGLRSLVLYAGEARSSDTGWKALIAHLDRLESLEVMMGENPERWLEMLLEAPLAKTLRALSVPGWIDAKLQARLKKLDAKVTFRRERRHRFNRATGYYVA